MVLIPFLLFLLLTLILSTHMDHYSQHVIEVTDGTPVISDSNVQLQSIGGTNLSVHNHMAGDYQAERTNNTITIGRFYFN